MPDVMIHLINEHGSFGYPGNYRVSPARVCKVLKLGNTALDNNDPLIKFVKLGKFDKDQVRQKVIDDGTLFELGISAKEIGLALERLVRVAEDANKTDMTLGNFRVVWEEKWRYLTIQNCILCHCTRGFGACYAGYIKNIKTDRCLQINDFGIHAILKHDYFCRYPNNRIDPILAVEVL